MSVTTCVDPLKTPDADSASNLELKLPLSDAKKRSWNRVLYRKEVLKALSSLSSLDDIRRIWERVFRKPCPTRILIRTAMEVILRRGRSAVALAKDLAVALSTPITGLYRAGRVEEAHAFWEKEMEHLEGGETGLYEVMLATGSIHVFQLLQLYLLCLNKVRRRDHRQVQSVAADIVQACYDALSRGHVDLHDEIYAYIRDWDKRSSPSITLPGPDVPGMTGSLLIEILERVARRDLKLLDPTCRAARDWVAHLIKHKDDATLGHRTLHHVLFDCDRFPHLYVQLSSEDIQCIQRAAAAANSAKLVPVAMTASCSTSSTTTATNTRGSSAVTTAPVNSSTATTGAPAMAVDAPMSVDHA
jgi:hypothetical protein